MSEPTTTVRAIGLPVPALPSCVDVKAGRAVPVVFPLPGYPPGVGIYVHAGPLDMCRDSSHVGPPPPWRCRSCGDAVPVPEARS